MGDVILLDLYAPTWLQNFKEYVQKFILHYLQNALQSLNTLNQTPQESPLYILLIFVLFAQIVTFLWNQPQEKPTITDQKSLSQIDALKRQITVLNRIIKQQSILMNNQLKNNLEKINNLMIIKKSFQKTSKSANQRWQHFVSYTITNLVLILKLLNKHSKTKSFSQTRSQENGFKPFQNENKSQFSDQPKKHTFQQSFRQKKQRQITNFEKQQQIQKRQENKVVVETFKQQLQIKRINPKVFKAPNNISNPKSNVPPPPRKIPPKSQT